MSKSRHEEVGVFEIQISHRSGFSFIVQRVDVVGVVVGHGRGGVDGEVQVQARTRTRGRGVIEARTKKKKKNNREDAEGGTTEPISQSINQSISQKPPFFFILFFFPHSFIQETLKIRGSFFFFLVKLVSIHQQLKAHFSALLNLGFLLITPYGIGTSHTCPTASREGEVV